MRPTQDEEDKWRSAQNEKKTIHISVNQEQEEKGWRRMAIQ